MGDSDIPKEVMKAYYGAHFPIEAFAKWLGHGGQEGSLNFTNREVSMTFRTDRGDRYARYQSFAGPAELKQKLASQAPIKIDVGAVYTHPPAQKKAVNPDDFKPISKEVVFDIDLTDYDNVRFCCSDKAMCQNCWKFCACGVEVVRKVMEECFGHSQAGMMAVYSGRRGVHLWVCDEIAMAYTDQERTALVEFLSLYNVKQGRMDVGYDLRNGTLHHALQDVLRTTIHQWFNSIYLQPIEEGVPCSSIFRPECARRILGIIEDQLTTRSLPQTNLESALKKARDTLGKQRGRNEQPLDVWNKLRTDMDKGTHSFLWVLDFVEMYCTFPRLDAAVSTKRNHLLKAPFSVHPASGKVCVPLFNQSEVNLFEIARCPHVEKLGGEDGGGIRIRKEAFEQFADRLHVPMEE